MKILFKSMFIFFFVSNMFTNMNLTILILNFSVLIFFYMYFILINLNEKWIMLMLMLFFLGGLMIFISMISSIFKYNKILKYNFTIAIMSLMFILNFYNMKIILNMDFSIVSTHSLMILYISTVLLFMILLLKDMIYKKQKNMKL